jgi:voltage-gated potassium channel
MQESFKRIFIGTAFFSVTLVVAIIGYGLFGWTLLDSIYMVVITIFGVGYGEVNPLKTPAEKIFTILVIIAGTSSAVYTVGGFVQMIAEGEINKALDNHRKNQELEKLEQHIIICGFGRMGQILAHQMQEARQSFVILDRNSDRISQAEALGYLAQIGNATDEDMLQAIGIEKAQVLAAILILTLGGHFSPLTEKFIAAQND